MCYMIILSKWNRPQQKNKRPNGIHESFYFCVGIVNWRDSVYFQGRPYCLDVYIPNCRLLVSFPYHDFFVSLSLSLSLSFSLFLPLSLSQCQICELCIYSDIWLSTNYRRQLISLKWTIMMSIPPPPPPQRKQILWTVMHYGSRHGHTEDFFMLGTGVKCNKLLKIYCTFCNIFLMETAPYPSPRCVQSWFSDKAMAS